jgi:hypothetical protein
MNALHNHVVVVLAQSFGPFRLIIGEAAKEEIVTNDGTGVVALPGIIVDLWQSLNEIISHDERRRAYHVDTTQKGLLD